MEITYSLPEANFQAEKLIEIQGTRSLHQFIGIIVLIDAFVSIYSLHFNLISIINLLFVTFCYCTIVLSENAIIKALKSFTFTAFLRILMASMITMLISKPLEIAIFSKQITKAISFNDFWNESVLKIPKTVMGHHKIILSVSKAEILFNINQSIIGSNMIQNEHQYKTSHGKIKEIEQFLDKLYKEKNSLHPRQFKMRENGLQGILAEIQEEIKEYDALKEKPIVIEIESFAEIPVALIKARIALGMTQKDLAEKLGMKEQQIQRYEANQYGSAGFHRLTEVAEALEVTLNSSLLTLRN